MRCIICQVHQYQELKIQKWQQHNTWTNYYASAKQVQITDYLSKMEYNVPRTREDFCATVYCKNQGRQPTTCQVRQDDPQERQNKGKQIKIRKQQQQWKG